MRLYELAGQYKSLQELDGMEPADIADTLEAIEGEIEQKAQAIVAVRAGMESDIAAIDAEIRRLQDRKKHIENQDKSVRDYLKHNMEAAGIKNIKCPLFSITLAKGRAVVVIDDESALPDEYVAVKTLFAPDKKRILDDLKAGKDVAGAHITESESSIRIR